MQKVTKIAIDKKEVTYKRIKRPIPYYAILLPLQLAIPAIIMLWLKVYLVAAIFLGIFALVICSKNFRGSIQKCLKNNYKLIITNLKIYEKKSLFNKVYSCYLFTDILTLKIAGISYSQCMVTITFNVDHKIKLKMKTKKALTAFYSYEGQDYYNYIPFIRDNEIDGRTKINNAKFILKQSSNKMGLASFIMIHSINAFLLSIFIYCLFNATLVACIMAVPFIGVGILILSFCSMPAYNDYKNSKYTLILTEQNILIKNATTSFKYKKCNFDEVKYLLLYKYSHTHGNLNITFKNIKHFYEFKNVKNEIIKSNFSNLGKNFIETIALTNPFLADNFKYKIRKKKVKNLEVTDEETCTNSINTKLKNIDIEVADGCYETTLTRLNLKTKKLNKKTNENKSIERKSNVVVAIIMFLISFLVGGGVVGLYIYNNNKVNNYIAIDATLIGFSVSESNSSENSNSTYSPLFEYEVNGKTYIYKGPGASRYGIKVGDQYKILYNPEIPSDAVMPDENILLLIVGIFFLLGSFMILLGSLEIGVEDMMAIIVATMFVLISVGLIYTFYTNNYLNNILETFVIEPMLCVTLIFLGLGLYFYLFTIINIIKKITDKIKSKKFEQFANINKGKE